MVEIMTVSRYQRDELFVQVLSCRDITDRILLISNATFMLV